jgi:hypothetical protein
MPKVLSAIGGFLIGLAVGFFLGPFFCCLLPLVLVGLVVAAFVPSLQPYRGFILGGFVGTIIGNVLAFFLSAAVLLGGLLG